MKIAQSHLCLRFYRHAGWTREAVRCLLRTDKRLARVMPRYMDSRDAAVGQGLWELNDGMSHDECKYFAVYDQYDPFDAKLLSAHEIA